MPTPDFSSPSDDDPPPLRSREPAASAGPVILVDDDSTDCMLIQKCYREIGCQRQLIVYPSGPDLVSYMRRVRQGRAPMPHAVLLDLNLYGVTGLEVLARIRSHETLRDQPPIYMLTHSHDVEDRQRARRLGATGYFTKPGDIDGVARLLAWLVDVKTPAVGARLGQVG